MALYLGSNRVKVRTAPYVKYSVVGTPTIVDGVASNLNDSNSIETSSSFAKNDWEMVLTIKTDTIGTNGNVRPAGNQSLFEMSGNTNTAVIIYGGKLNLSGVGNIGDFSLSSNTLYEFKFTYKASDSLLSAFVSNNSWQLIGTRTIANLFGKVVFGRRTTLTDRYFLGSFDLNNTYIKVDGQYWWRGDMQNVETYTLHTLAGDYGIDNGKLVWANPNLYLQNTSNSYIDTGILADSKTQAILEYKIDDFKTIDSGTRNYIIGGSAIYQQMANFYAIVWAQGSPASARYWLNTSDKGAATTAGSAFTDKTAKYKLTLNGTDIDVKSYVVKDDGTTYSYTNTAGTITQDKNIHIFNRGNNPTSTYSFLGKIYNCIINQNGIAVRHFVPVPVGLQIGDYTVPSNGMWDIVTQTFFGNSGSGDFIYGKD